METKLIRKNFFVNLVFFFFILSFNLVSSQPPQFGDFNEGLAIEVPLINEHKANTSFDFYIHVYNRTTGALIDNSSIYCFLHIYSPEDGTHILKQNMTFDGVEFELEVLGSNFSRIGKYSKLYTCQANDLSYGGFTESEFIIRPSEFLLDSATYFILLILSLGLAILGFYIQDKWIVILGGFATIMLGLFLLFYGIDGFKDNTYTWAIGLITLVLGIYLSIRGSFESL